MPMSVIERLYLENYEKAHLSQLDQDQAHNNFGMHTISMVERANMLALMKNWMAHHDAGDTEDVFVEEFKEFARPLHSRKGKAALEQAAKDARASGGNELHAQIRRAAELRAQRANLFDWDKDKKYNAGTAAIANLEKGLEDMRKARFKGMRKYGNQYTDALVPAQSNPVATVASKDSTTLATSAVQACVLDALLHKYNQVRMLFTTWKLVEGTTFLRVLASSLNLYNRGFIMNPTILRANAPKASAINWDIRLNDYFLHSGIYRNAAFIFVTSSVDYETFLDPATKDAAKRAQMIAAPVGSKVPSLGTRGDMNYPVKPGGSEILTLLEYGYDVEQQDAQFYQDAKLGFIMVPGRRHGPRKEHFLQMHSTFTQAKYDRLIAFTQQLAKLGIYH